MPDWLLKTEDYMPSVDKDTFINKSILSLLNLISHIKTQETVNVSKININPVLKVMLTFLLAILISLSTNFSFIIIILAYLLVLLASSPSIILIKVLRLSILMSVFTFIIVLPSTLWGNTNSSIMLISKVFATVTLVNLLSHSVKWNEITGAMKRFFVPDIFIFVMDITIKYILLLGEYSLNMLYALKLRSVGKNNRKYTSMSGIAGTMFLKSKEMAEDLYHAMECRGFTGEYKRYDNFKIRIQDYAYIFLHIGIIVVFLYLH